MTQEKKKDQDLPIAGRRYRHYKGGIYEVIAVALDADNYPNDVVVYRNENGVIFTRSMESWNSKANITRFEEIPEHFFPDEKTVAQINKILSDIKEDLETSKPNKDGFSFFGEVVDVTREDLNKINQEFELGGKSFKNSEGSIYVSRETSESDTQNFVPTEVVRARVLLQSDMDGETTDIPPTGGEDKRYFIVAPKKEGGKVKRQFGIPGEDYLILGEGFVKIVSKEKFELKYKHEIPF